MRATVERAYALHGTEDDGDGHKGQGEAHETTCVEAHGGHGNVAAAGLIAREIQRQRRQGSEEGYEGTSRNGGQGACDEVEREGEKERVHEVSAHIA